MDNSTTKTFNIKAKPAILIFSIISLATLIFRAFVSYETVDGIMHTVIKMPETIGISFIFSLLPGLLLLFFCVAKLKITKATKLYIPLTILLYIMILVVTRIIGLIKSFAMYQDMGYDQSMMSSMIISTVVSLISGLIFSLLPYILLFIGSLKGFCSRVLVIAPAVILFFGTAISLLSTIFTVFASSAVASGYYSSSYKTYMLASMIIPIFTFLPFFILGIANKLPYALNFSIDKEKTKTFTMTHVKALQYWEEQCNLCNISQQEYDAIRQEIELKINQ